MSDSERQSPVRDESEKPPPPSAEAPRPPATPSVRRAARRSAFILIAIAVLLIGATALSIASHWEAFSRNGIFALPQFRLTGPGVNPPAPNASAPAVSLGRDITGLKDQIAAMEARVAVLENSGADAQSAGAALGDMRAQLGSMETRLTALEAEIARIPDRDALTGLQDRLSRLETENADALLRRAAATLALANLARAAETASPFRRELDALSLIAPDDPAIPSLAALADSGVPMLAILKARFPDVARAALAAERENAAGEDFFGRLKASLGRLISIRRIGDVEGMTNEDRLARAGADLDRNDLAAAAMEAQNIMGAAAMAIAPWVKDAEARLAVDRAVAEIDARIVQALASPAAPQQRTGTAAP